MSRLAERPEQVLARGGYADDGCDLAPSCLRCPFERCRYDEPMGYLTIRNRERDEAVRVLGAMGLTQTVLAADYGVSPRTIRRALA